MRKIPTLFVRDPDDRRHVTDDVTPGCEWVLAGEGVATRKFDGTCFLYDGQWWARREVKPGKADPPNFKAVTFDEATGKTMGWEPADQSSFAVPLHEAADYHPEDFEVGLTYELCGPRINGNPEGFGHHVLVAHGVEKITDVPLDYDGLAAWMADSDFEGIVWHHPDGRMAKLKRRDFA